MLILAALLAALFVFRDSIIDFLPIDQSGWVERDGNKYLLDENGAPRTGWFRGEEGCFYFREDGVMHTGWLSTSQSRFYFRQDGIMHTGWLEEGSERYYFSPEGKLYTGWQTMDGVRCYFDKQGRLASGLLEQGGKRYYLDENGVPTEGWQQVDGKKCYVTLEGTIPRGWMDMDGQKLYFNDRGFCHTGWLDDSSGRYYFDAEGVMTTGWAELEGKRYYFSEDGTAYAGWLEEDGKRYYIREDGSAAVGKLEIDGEAYFFSSTGVNFILVNPWHFLPKDYEPELVQACGTWLDPACQEALEKMLADCRAAGYTPEMVSGYRSYESQRANLNRMVQSYIDQGYCYEFAYATATQIVAVPGTSEHHLGLAFDIVDKIYGALDYEQANTPTQKWLMEHCWEYGFILRFPENSTEITGIIWEPWHYRYVGVEIAMEIYELGCIPLETYIDNLTGDGTTCGGRQPEA